MNDTNTDEHPGTLAWDTPEWWDAQYRQGDMDGGVPDHVVLREAATLPPGTALDLGCGAGHLALRLAEQGWQVLGLDWSAEAVHLAGAAAAKRGLPARFQVADTTTWQPDARYGLVLSTYALPGRDATAAVLQTAAQALAPGGTLIIVEWHREMAAVWGFAPEDLSTPEEIAAGLAGLRITCCERREVQVPFPDPGQPSAPVQMQPATISVVIAQRPA